jgi:hypothetical protein
MDTLVLDTIGKLWRHGYGMFGWCSDCGSPTRYRDDVSRGALLSQAMFDINLVALLRDRGENSPVVRSEPIPCPRLDR